MPLREIISVNGRITPAEEAVMPVRDDGLYRGDGVFEVVRLYEGRPFALGEHLDRLERSGTLEVGRLVVKAGRSPRQAVHLPAELVRLWRART